MMLCRLHHLISLLWLLPCWKQGSRGDQGPGPAEGISIGTFTSPLLSSHFSSPGSGVLTSGVLSENKAPVSYREGRSSWGAAWLLPEGERSGWGVLVSDITVSSGVLVLSLAERSSWLIVMTRKNINNNKNSNLYPRTTWNNLFLKKTWKLEMIPCPWVSSYLVCCGLTWGRKARGLALWSSA